MLKIPTTEKFKEIELEGDLQFRYAISNQGRLISFTDKFADGRILKGSVTEGYRIFRYKIRKGGEVIHKHRFFYRLVAEKFLRKSAKQSFVIHLNHNSGSDVVTNLKWVTREEMLEHQQTSPKVKKARKKLIEFNKNRDGHKLTAAKVIAIKKLISNPNRKITMKVIAERYDISEMQLYRIKKGENWGHIKI